MRACKFATAGALSAIAALSLSACGSHNAADNDLSVGNIEVGNVVVENDLKASELNSVDMNGVDLNMTNNAAAPANSS